MIHAPTVIAIAITVLALLALASPRRTIALLILLPFLPFLLMRWVGVQLILLSEAAVENRRWTRALTKRAVAWLNIPEQYR